MARLLPLSKFQKFFTLLVAGVFFCWGILEKWAKRFDKGVAIVV